MARFTIDDDTVRIAHSVLAENGNWKEIDTPFGIVSDRTDPQAFRIVLERAMATRDEARLDRVREVLPLFTVPTLHPVAAELLRHYDVDPLDLAIISAATGKSVDINTEDGSIIGFWHSQRNVDATVSFHLEEGTIWEHVDEKHSIEIFQTRLADTMLIGLGGEPLARVVSHPALDAMGLRISKASIFGPNDSTCLKLDPYEPVQREKNVRIEAVANEAIDVAPPRVATGVAVVDEAGRILCLRRGPDAATGAGEIAIPGGKLDPGETLAACAARELLEEVGIVATKMVRLEAVTEDMAWGPSKHFVTLYFMVEEWTGEPRVMEPTKHTELRWLFPSQIRALIATPDSENPVFEPLAAFNREGGITEVFWRNRARRDAAAEETAAESVD